MDPVDFKQRHLHGYLALLILLIIVITVLLHDLGAGTQPERPQAVNLDFLIRHIRWGCVANVVFFDRVLAPKPEKKMLGIISSARKA